MVAGEKDKEKWSRRENQERSMEQPAAGKEGEHGAGRRNLGTGNFSQSSPTSKALPSPSHTPPPYGCQPFQSQPMPEALSLPSLGSQCLEMTSRSIRLPGDPGGLGAWGRVLKGEYQFVASPNLVPTTS